MELERWLWDHAADWIGGTPGEATRARLADAPAGAVPDDLWTYLAPGLTRADSPGLRARAVGRAGAAMLEERRQTAAAIRVGTALRDRDVAHVFFKGADLRHRLYDSPHQRDSQDLDLLCAPEGLPAALDALRAVGFRDEGDPRAVLEGRTHETALRAEDAVVDLHVGPVQPGRTRFDARDVLAGRVEIEVDGGSLAVPAPSDALGLCLVHVGVHEGGGEHVAFKHALDLALAFRRWPELDWPALAARLARWRCLRLAGAGLWTWEPALAALAPRAAFDAIDPGPIQRALARRARADGGRDRRPARGPRRLGQLVRKFLYAEGWPERTWLVRELFRRTAGQDPSSP